MDKNFNNRRMVINMICTVAAFFLNTAISFFLTPYVTGKFGSEAYGFIKLATDITNYASLVSLALNSMSSRFIMLEREIGHIREANEYYSSLMAANVVLTVVMGAAAWAAVVNLDRLVSIPLELVGEVKVVFALTFANFLLALAMSVYSTCYYLSNRMDLHNMRSAIAALVKAGTIFGLFLLFQPKLRFVAVGTLVSTVCLVVMNVACTRKLTPDMRVDRRYFRMRRVNELLLAGMWNGITKLSQSLSTGLDLLITNLLVSPQMMGYLSIAKTVPTMINSLIATVANVFSPNMMALYARGDLDGLKKATKSAMRMMCLFVSIPNAILITMGREFFQLWVPGQPAELINTLSVLTVIGSCVIGPAQPLYQIFTITNKMRQSSTAMILYGLGSVLGTYICLRVTNLGVYAVAGVSLVGSIIVALVYHIPYAAKYLGLPKITFFPEIGISVLSTAVLCVIGFVVNHLFDLSASWFMWFFGACLTGGMGLCINAMLLLTRDERKMLLTKLLGRKK